MSRVKIGLILFRLGLFSNVYSKNSNSKLNGGKEVLYNVTWENSQTKQIYNATKRSEELMSYLEDSLLNSELVQLIGEKPVPDKGREYGEMIYYYNSKPKRRLLSAAPRRDNDYIHVVIFRGILTKEKLKQNCFELGSYPEPTPDIKLHSKAEIDVLIELLKKMVQRI